MAEYRGLTVRIGADTTRFTEALKATHGAISDTQKNLRELKQALVLNPRSTNAGALYVGELQSQAVAATSKMALLRKEMDELGKKKLASGKGTISELAEKTDDAALSARRAREAYNDVDDALSSIYTELSKASHETFDLKPEDAKKYVDAWTQAMVEQNRQEIEAKKQQLIETQNLGKAEAARLAKEEVGYLKVADARKKAYEIVSSMNTGQTFNVDNSNIDAITAELQRLVDSGKMSEEEMNNVASAVRRLKKVWQDYFNNLRDANDVQHLHDTQVQVEHLDAQVESLANEMADLSRSELSISLEPEIDKLKNLHTETERAQEKFRQLDAALKLDPTNLDLAIQRAEALREATEAGEREAEQFRSVISKYDDAGIDKVLDSTKDLAQATEDARDGFVETHKSVISMASDVDTIRNSMKEMRVDGATQGDQWLAAMRATKGAKQETQEASAAAAQAKENYDRLNDAGELSRLRSGLQESENSTARLGNEAEKTGAKMNSSLVLVLQEVAQLSKQAFQSVVDSTVNIDDALTNVRKTVEATDEQYQQLKDNAIAASKVQPIDAATIMNAEALGGQLGFMVDEVEKFAEVATGLDVSTNMGWEQASTNMAQFANIMNMNSDDVDRYGATIVDLGNNFATTESDISDMSMRIAGAGSALGMTEADVLGLSAALTSMGLTAEAGGSSISQIMTNIDKAVANGTAGVKGYADSLGMSVSEFAGYLDSLDDDAFEDVAKSFGMTAKSFKKDTVDSMHALDTWAETANMDVERFASLWADRPIEALEAVFSGIDKAVHEEDSNLSLLLEDLGITSIRQSDVARRMSSNSNKVTEAVTRANEAWEENTALATEVSRRNESLSGQMDIMKNSLAAVKAELGEGLMPIVKLGATGMRTFSTVLDGMPGPAKTATLSIMGLFAGFATAWPILDRLGGYLDETKTKIIQFAGAKIAESNFAAGVQQMSTSMYGLLSVSKLVYASVGVLGAAIAVHLIKKAAEAAKVQRDFYTELAKVGRYTNDTTDGLKSYSRTIGMTSSEAKNMSTSTEELTEILKNHNESMRSMQTEANTTTAQLQRYRDVIDGVRGKTALTTEEHSELRWAIDGVNSALGTQFTEEDVLTGKYVDENGVIQDTIASLDALIQKRQDEARARADQEMYEESLKNEAELTRVWRDNKKAFEEYAERRRSFARQTDEFKNASDSEIDDWLRRVDEDFRTLEASARNSGQAVSAASEETARSFQQMVNDEVLADAQVSVENLRGKIRELGGTGEEVANLTADQIKGAIERSQGDVDSLAEEILKLNGIEPIKIDLDADDAKASVDDLMHSVKNIGGSDTKVNTEINVTTSGVVEAQDSLLQTHGLLDQLANVFGIDLTANTDDVDAKVETTQNLVNSFVGGFYQTKLYGDATSAVNAAVSARSAVWSVPTSHVTYFSGSTSALEGAVSYARSLINSYESRAANIVSAKFQAAGGLRYHADGMILNRPTWIGGRDIAGEAGAEAIIPLTNRKYVQPFADTVAEGMLSKLGGLSGGTTYNLYLDGLRVNDDAAIRQDVLNLLSDLRRRANMNNG